MPNQREWLEEFIEIYRSEPSLWKVKAKEYHDRDKKEAAYRRLLVKLREVEPTSDKAAVVKKINNLRCTYNKEHKKVNASNKSGAGTEEIYEPKLWYYPLLKFLDDQHVPRPSRSNLDDEVNSPESAPLSVEESVKEAQDFEDSSVVGVQQTPTTESTTSSSSTSRKRKSEADLTKDVLISVRDHFKLPAPSPPPPKQPDDRYDIFGKSVAFKLRDLNKTQRILAEKNINETLTEAELGQLTTSHTVMAPFPNSPFHQRSYSTSSSQFNHSTSPYSNQPSPQSQRSIYEQTQAQPQVVYLSIPESPGSSGNNNVAPTQQHATQQQMIQSQPSSTSTVADFLSNYDAY
ncbi:uncharacterized protein LOC133524893 [Cydia pomonella]|uniref:uncharacterized protein LOC133524893 n=1 Tax=Cydia pomonella TaxID=82600 RepID=UPI002ADD9E2C|nr:uncharacterized protein LOC133524893 [Cydia pomonella]